MKIKNTDIYGATSKVRGLSIAQLGIITFVLQALAISVLMALIVLLFCVDLSSTHQQKTEQVAAQLAAQIQAYVKRYAAVAQSIAQQKTAIAYYQNKKMKALKKLALIIEGNNPDILKIRFRTLDQKKPDRTAVPHLGYAGLELLRMAAEQKQPPIAEIHSPNKPNEQLAFVHRVESNDRLIGLLHLSVTLKRLKSMLKNMQLEHGVVQIQHVLGDNKIIKFATAGDTDLLAPEPDAVIQVPGSHLQVAFWSDSALSLLFAPLLLKYWVLLVLSVLLLGGIQTFMSNRVVTVLRLDQVTVLNLFADFVKGELKAQYPSKLLDFRGTLEALAKSAREAKIDITQPTELESAPVEPQVEEQALDDLLLHPFEDDGLDITNVTEDTPKQKALVQAPDEIFLAYDIRGIVDQTLTNDVVYALGLSIGSEALARGEHLMIVGRDGRLTSEAYANTLMQGLNAAGVDVIDIGLTPTPVLYFATHILESQSGVMVTGSHNPATYNGFKITLQGEPLYGDGIQAIKRRIEENDLSSGQGSKQEQAMGPEYINQIMEDVHLGRPLKVVLDCGHGVAAELAPMLLKTLGVELIELNCEVDGRFPSHHPDPSRPENLVELQAAVRDTQADLGIAFDGDADRIGVIDSQGKIIWPDRLIMLFAMDILTRQPGADVIYDVKCTRNLAKEIVKFGGRPIMWKTGHSMIHAKIKETGAALGGDFTGHIFINERWYGFDDAIYAACRLLEVLSADFRASHEVFADFPESLSTPEIIIETAMGENHTILAQLSAQASFPGGKITDLDGLRVDFEDGWGLIRASNTMPSIVVRFEGEDAQSIQKMHALFNQVLQAVAPHLAIAEPQFDSAPSGNSVAMDEDFGLSFE